MAATLGVCAATVYGLAADGHLARVRVLNAIRVAPRDLEALVEGRRPASTPRRLADARQVAAELGCRPLPFQFDRLNERSGRLRGC